MGVCALRLGWQGDLFALIKLTHYPWLGTARLAVRKMVSILTCSAVVIREIPADMP